MITRLLTILFTSCSTFSCAQKIDLHFKEVALPLSGKKEFFGSRDLAFYSNPQLLDDSIVKILSPTTAIENTDSIFNMETGKFLGVQKRKVRCYGFYKITLSGIGYCLIYSIADKTDEYGFNVYLNVYDLDDQLLTSERIYSNSESLPFRNFKLTHESLLLVDYLPTKTEVIVEGKKKKVFTTVFKIRRLRFDNDEFRFVEIISESKHGSLPPSKYKDADTYLKDDPISNL